ncbi:DUF5320 domain-containing protein [Nitratidesulfovibrio sp. 1201_IL3209]|uniref:DUF5320 domain-containing protein n=1 Tax=Nitratidesulfovibrio sp. 1201_IL3209 TaxID=3084053 RepID=UPI002FDB6363
MPGMNGTGPLGQGPGTGRGMGRCGAARARRGSAGRPYPPVAEDASAEASALDELAANLGNVLDTARDVIDALRPDNGRGNGQRFGKGAGRGTGQGRGQGFGSGRGQGHGRGRGRGPAVPPATGDGR